MIIIRHRGRRGSHSTAQVTFVLPHDQPCGTVSVVGDFNDWRPALHVLTLSTYGTRAVTVTLPRGRTSGFRYRGEGGREFADPDDANVEVVTT